MKGVRARTRVEWIKAVLGKSCRFTAKQFRRVQWRLAEREWFMAGPAEGPAFERVVAVDARSPACSVVQAYCSGQRWYALDELSRAVGASITDRAGALRLATVGFAVLRVNGDRVELRCADPRAARLVNEARLGPQARGFSVRRVIEAFLQNRHPDRSRVNVTDRRRQQAKEMLREQWSIECADLVNGRSRARLASTWSFGRTPPTTADGTRQGRRRRRNLRRRF